MHHHHEAAQLHAQHHDDDAVDGLPEELGQLLAEEGDVEVTRLTERVAVEVPAGGYQVEERLDRGERAPVQVVQRTSGRL